MTRPHITLEERSGARKAFSRKNPGGVSPAARLFAEILSLSMDEAALGVAMGQLDPDSLQPLPEARGASALSEARHDQLQDALESARFLRSPAAARLCGDLGTDPGTSLQRVRKLAEQKAPRARLLLERDEKMRKRAAAMEALYLARRDTATGITVLSSGDLIPDRSKFLRGQDLTGRRSGLLTVVERGGFKGRMRLWVVRCDCGTVKQLARKIIGRVDSCGCARMEKARQAAAACA